jgi:dolichyl-phosphate-mannose--protein O-mannosyl transferase
MIFALFYFFIKIKSYPAETIKIHFIIYFFCFLIYDLLFYLFCINEQFLIFYSNFLQSVTNRRTKEKITIADVIPQVNFFQ